MDWCCPWPYAAKAVIQHEYSVDHLNVWMTFGFAMDTEKKDPDTGLSVPKKPPDELWLVKVDGYTKTVVESRWQDAWTLLLTVGEVFTPPNRVLVEYLGPHPDLTISWQKQWEPWGPILSLDITT